MEDQEALALMTEKQGEIEMLMASEEIKVPSEPQRFSCIPVCEFSKQAKHRSESDRRTKSATKLCGLISFYLIFMVIEIVGGAKANSLAILTDAAHLLVDIAGFSISLFAVWTSGWEATSHQSFGFSRLEVLGALLSGQLIWLIAGILMYEAIDRILHRHELVNGKLMFVIAAFGFVINFILVNWLGHNHIHKHPTSEEENTNLISNSAEDHQCEVHACSESNESKSNMNLQGAYLHVMADLIQSVRVMIAGAIIWVKPDWLVVDLVCTLGFSVLVLFTTVPMLRNILGILMESTPNEIDIRRLETGIECIEVFVPSMTYMFGPYRLGNLRWPVM